MPADDEAIAILPGLSPIHGRAIEACFDSAMMSSDGGLLVLREIEQRLGIARRLAACIRDPRAPERIVHGLDEIIRFRMLMIAAGYEDGNDADHRHQSRWCARPHRLPGYLLRPRPGREPHQGLEDPSRRRPHLMLPRHRQPDGPVPAHRRLLAVVEPAGSHAAAFSLAGGPVRHPAPAPDQAGREGRGTKKEGHAPAAAFDREPAAVRLRAGPAAANAHLSSGAKCPVHPAPANLNAAATEPTQRRTPARLPT